MLRNLPNNYTLGSRDFLEQLNGGPGGLLENGLNLLNLFCCKAIDGRELVESGDMIFWSWMRRFPIISIDFPYFDWTSHKLTKD